jgi:hypothetical protein
VIYQASEMAGNGQQHFVTVTFAWSNLGLIQQRNDCRYHYHTNAT